MEDPTNWPWTDAPVWQLEGGDNVSGMVGEGARPLPWVSPFAGAHRTSGALDANPATVSRLGGGGFTILF